MKKGEKFLLGVLVVVGIICVFFIVVLNRYKANRVDVLIPRSTLSDSLFDSQNTTYTKSDNLPLTKELEKLPYTVDIPDAVSGVSGDTTIYNLDEDYFFCITEVLKGEEYHQPFLRQFSKAVLINSHDEYGTTTPIVTTAGYRNGYAAEYFVDKIKISDGIEIQEATAIGYLINIPEEDYNLLISTVTRSYTTEALALCHDLNDLALGTLQFSETLKQMHEEEEALRMQEEDTEPVSEEELPVEESTVQEEDVLPAIPEDAILKEEPMTVDKEYSSLLLECAWENTETMVSLKLYGPSKAFFFSPIEYRKGVAVFECGQVLQGEYVMEVYGKDYGALSYTFKETAVNEQEPTEPAETE